LTNNTLPELVGDYLEHVRANGRSAATVSQYRFALSVFLRFCGTEGLQTPDQLTARGVDRYSAWLREQPGSKGRPLSEVSANTYLRSLNLFLSWLAQRGKLARFRAQTQKPEHEPLEVLSQVEIEAMVRAASNPRDRLIVLILAETGCRLGELIGLRVGDLVVQGGHHFLNLRGRAGERWVAIRGDLYRQLMAYISGGRPGSPVDEEPVFMAQRRRDGKYEALTPSGVQQMIRYLARDAGIRKRVHPHLFRHTYGTEFIARGGDSAMLAKVLGQRSLAVINSLYAHPRQSQIAQAMLDHLRRVESGTGR
jgi:site-specific recombinase XerD